MSFWYRTTDQRVATVQMHGWFWDSTNCYTGSGSGSVLEASAIKDGAWHQVSGSSSAHAGQAFNLEIGFLCSSACAGAQVNFDDVVYDQAPPTAVRARSIRAVRTRSGVLLRWRTEAATDILGFNVYRARKGKLTKLNRTLIPSAFGGTPSAHAYSWLDRDARSNRASIYRLQALSLSGKRTWIGSATLAA